MNMQLIVDIGRKAILTAGLLAMPVLAAGLIVGLLVSVIQAVTQIHEMTLTFIPKIIAIAAVLYFLLPWMLKVLLHYTSSLYLNLGMFIK
ncbi:flagellar biosynthetic protein FliQ [Candidatus Aerophobetes bacterium]|uniref:Flagellar biosynthetic protein FliQ n=1 Tax=Aerophobetes bacterium TaxID=2030807 RepID=A0A497E2K6_UNCAE|nr:MAG: flagellar biosynthetic protein FliQ [Candidatus Aerophobetes bacterium]